MSIQWFQVLIYAIFVAVGITGFWEMIESIKKELWFKTWPNWFWLLLQALIPVLGIELWNVLLPPVSFYTYAITFLSVLHLHRKEHAMRWIGVLTFLVSVLVFILTRAWLVVGVDRVIVIEAVELFSLILFFKKRRILWLAGLLVIWIFLKPIWMHFEIDQLKDIFQVFILGIPLLLYTYECLWQDKKAGCCNEKMQCCLAIR